MKKTTWALTALLLLCVLCISVLSACGSSETTETTTKFNTLETSKPAETSKTPETSSQPASEGLVFVYDEATDGYSVTGIGSCSDTHIVIPSQYEGKSVTSIGDEAFYRCTSLTGITVSENNPNYRSIDGVLYNKEKTELIAAPGAIQAIVIPDSVTSIGSWAFYYCTSLTSITIPDSVTSIGVAAFEYCTSLTDIYCEADSQPDGWYRGLLTYCNAAVHWGDRWEYVDGVPTLK